MGTIIDSNGASYSFIESWVSVVGGIENEAGDTVPCISGVGKMSGSFNEDGILLDAGGEGTVEDGCPEKVTWHLYSTDVNGWKVAPQMDDWGEYWILDIGTDSVTIEDLTIDGSASAPYTRGLLANAGQDASVALHRVLVKDITSDDDGLDGAGEPYVIGISANVPGTPSLATYNASLLLHRCAVENIKSYVTDPSDKQADAIGIYMGHGYSRAAYDGTSNASCKIQYCTAKDVLAPSGITGAAPGDPGAGAYGMLFMDASGHLMTNNVSHGVFGVGESGVTAFCYNIVDGPNIVQRVVTGTHEVTGFDITATSGVEPNVNRGTFDSNQSSDATGSLQGVQADINSFISEGYEHPSLAYPYRPDPYCSFDPINYIDPLMIGLYTGAAGAVTPPEMDVALNGMVGSPNLGAYGYHHVIKIETGADYPGTLYPLDDLPLEGEPMPSGWQRTFSTFAAAVALTDGNPPVLEGGRYNWPGGPLEEDYQGYRIGHELRTSDDEAWFCVTFSPEKEYSEQIRYTSVEIGGDDSSAPEGRPGGEGPVATWTGTIFGGTLENKVLFRPSYEGTDEAFIRLADPDTNGLEDGDDDELAVLVQNIKVEAGNKRWNALIETPNVHNCIVNASGYMSNANTKISSVQYGIVAKQVTNCLAYGDMDYGISSTSSRHTFEPLVYANNTLYINNVGSQVLNTEGIESSGGTDDIAFNNLLLSTNGKPILANGVACVHYNGGKTNINDGISQAGNYFLDVGQPLQEAKTGYTQFWWDGNFSEYDFGLTPTSHAINSGIIPQFRSAASTDLSQSTNYRNWFNKGSAWPNESAWPIPEMNPPGNNLAGSGVFDGGGLFLAIGNGNHMMIDGHITPDIRVISPGAAVSFDREEYGGQPVGTSRTLVWRNRFPPYSSDVTFDCGYDERNGAGSQEVQTGGAFIAFMDF